MKNKLKRKLIISIIVSIILIGCFFVAHVISSVTEIVAKQNEVTERKIDTIVSSLDSIYSVKDELHNEFEHLSRNNLRVIRCLLKEFVEDGRYTGPVLFEDGAMVSYTDGVLVYPDHETRLLPEIDAVSFQDLLNSSGTLTSKADINGETKDVAVSAIEIIHPYYYLDWTGLDEINDYINSSFSDSEVFRQMEEAYDLTLLVKDEEDGYLYNGFEGTDVNLTDLPLESIDDKLHDLGHEKYPFISASRSLKNSSIKVYFFEQSSSTSYLAGTWSPVFAFTSLIIILTMIAWNYSVQKLVSEHVLTGEQEANYRPDKVRRVNLFVCLLGALLVFFLVQYSQSLSELYLYLDNGHEVIDLIAKDSQDFDPSYIKSELSEWHIYYSDRIASLCGRYPKLQNDRVLKEVADILDVNYITLYDDEGKQICNSEGFKDLVLDGDLADFKVLNLGKKSLSVDDFYDRLVEKKVSMKGVRMELPDKERYGALLLSLNDYDHSVLEDSKDLRITSLVPAEDLFFIIDRASGKIISSNDESYLGDDIKAYNISLDEGDMMNFFVFNGKRFYGISDQNEELSYCYFINDSKISGHTIIQSRLGSILFVIAYAITAFILLRGYNDKFFYENMLSGEPAIRGTSITIETTAGQQKKTVEPKNRYDMILRFWRQLLPEQKARNVFIILLTLTLLRLFRDVYKEGEIRQFSLVAYLIQGDWKRGFNIFALTSIGLLIIVILLIMIALRLLFTFLIKIFETKGETVCRLIYGLCQYIAFFCFLYFAFGFLGINTTALLASAGFVSLAISLGSRDLVSDILAGITIVFEGDFRVGDMVEVAGYRGQVMEIGVRSTKLLGRGNNIKIVNNRDIKNILNMTRLNSWVPIEITVPGSMINEAEKLLEEKLPEIGKKMTEIINGPYYYGILKVANDNMTLSILAECKEEDFHRVQRFLNREIYLLLKANQITTK
jgi:small-conductance mechanosensitive channel